MKPLVIKWVMYGWVGLMLGLPVMAADADMPVFILAGQSNMKGGGAVSELPPDLNKTHLDVLIIDGTDRTFKPLDPQTMNGKFGPEVTFGIEMSMGLKCPVGLVKFAQGGTSLEVHWNPLATDEKAGMLYRKLIQRVQGLRETNPNINFAGMIWMQGEADSRYHAKTADQYKSKLEALIDGVRKATGQADLPFVCGRVNPPDWPYMKQVREAQETVARKPYVFINCDDLEKKEDKLHYTTKGQIELGKRFAAAMLKLTKSDSK